MFDVRRAIPAGPTFSSESPHEPRNNDGPSGVYRAMKRDNPSLLAITLRTGFMVGFALILILVLLPAVLGAQAAGIR
jgi:hypothetical protein